MAKHQPVITQASEGNEFEVRIPLGTNGRTLQIYVDHDDEELIHVFLLGAKAKQIAVLPLAANHLVIREVETV